MWNTRLKASNFLANLGDLNDNKYMDKFGKAVSSVFYISGRRYSGCPRNLDPGFYYGECHSVLRTSRLQNRFKNWQHLRKDKLTASTFASVVGFWPRGRTRLWLEKLGTIEPFSGNLATSWSNIHEEEALKNYMRITHYNYQWSDPCFEVYDKRNPEHNWLAASPDGIVETCAYGLPSRGILEIKCPYFGDMSKVSPFKRMPVHYIPQAQGLMEILDRDWIHIYVWTKHGSSLFRLHRNVEYWNILKIALSDFWWNHVQLAKEICERSLIKIRNPLVELSSLRPAPTHELLHCIVRESKRDIDNSELLAREIGGYFTDYNMN